MSRIPGFDQRLKALLFKSNFAEKVDEVKEVSLRRVIQAMVSLPKLSGV